MEKVEEKTGKKRRSRWRWVWRGAAAVLVLVIVLGAIPFVFTTRVVRWGIGRSGYARFSPEVGSATLSADGELVLRDVVLHEMPPYRERVLARAGVVRVRFGWGEVMGGAVESVRAEGVEVHLRRGEGGEATLAELWGGNGSAEGAATQKGGATTATTQSAPAGKPFWVDDLYCSGKVEVEGEGVWGLLPGSYSAEVGMRMSGDREKPTRGLTGTVEGASGSGEVRVEMAPGEWRVEEVSGKGLKGKVTKAMTAGLGKGLQRDYQVGVERVEGNGVVAWEGAGPVWRGRVAVGGVGVDGGDGYGVKGLRVAGDVAGPLSAEFLRVGEVVKGKIALQSVTYGKNEVNGLKGEVTVEKGELDATQVGFEFAKGAFSGAVGFSLAERRLMKADFTVSHLDQSEVAENLAGDRFDAEGMVDGEIHLGSNAKGVVVGEIVLNTDGPGRLQIKDQQTAEALAEKLQAGSGGGVLPSNFSQIVVAQLKDYPYTTGHIGVSAPEGLPVVTLNYQRAGVKPGEPGYGVKANIGGHEVLANYTVQLPGVTIVLKGKTVEEILALAVGLGKEIGAGATGK